VISVAVSLNPRQSRRRAKRGVSQRRNVGGCPAHTIATRQTEREPLHELPLLNMDLNHGEISTSQTRIAHKLSDPNLSITTSTISIKE
jgi:hypothetical protein